MCMYLTWTTFSDLNCQRIPVLVVSITNHRMILTRITGINVFNPPCSLRDATVQDIIDLREFGSAPVEDRLSRIIWEDLWWNHSGTWWKPKLYQITSNHLHRSCHSEVGTFPFHHFHHDLALSSLDIQDWMTVSWVRLGPSYGQLPNEVRQLNELARESDRFRRAGD